MTKSAQSNMILSAVILSCWTFIYIGLVGLSPGFKPKPHRGIGQVMAAEAVKVLGSGGRITVLTRDTAIFKNPAADAQLQGFRQTLSRAGAKPALTRLLRPNPIALVAVPPGEFYDMLRKQTEADVVVSFMGPAVLDEAQLAKLGAKRPKILALCSGTLPQRVQLKRLFDQQLLHAAVIDRPHLLSGAPTSGSARGWFDHLYQLVTPANLGEAPLPETRP